MHAENKHWDDIEHSLFTFKWASHLILSDLSGTVVTENQQQAYADYLTASAETGVQFLAIRTRYGLEHYVCLSFVVEGENEQQALQNTTAAALEGLESVGVDVDNLEFVEAHLVYEEQLKEDNLVAARAGQPLKHIYDRDYIFNPEEARDIFGDLKPVFQEIASF
ncbi:MAG TPA: hypothetical protein VNE40_02695 [Candidatus Dormibacteraeota bacterium]|nr:hypothetical protein [Candidatus Dormibacteraeota bacterium]